MGVDHGDGRQEVDRINRRLRILETASPANHTEDSQHPGAGFESIQIGVGARAEPVTDSDADEAIAIGSSATADGFGAVAIGARSYAQYENASAFGWLAFAGHTYATAIGYRTVTTADHQIRLGRAEDTVSVPGTFSNPSARRHKQNITPAPTVGGLFPVLVEYEYIDNPGVRKLGHIADDMLGTDAERFITFNDEGEVDGIDYIGLLVAQVAALQARVTELEGKERHG